MQNFRTLILCTLLMLQSACYNGDKTLIPRQPFVPLEVEEGFNLVFEPKVDILFVVDDSGSMTSAQARLAQNISLFSKAMERNKFLDYHMGVISTSYGPSYPSKSGLLQGNPRFITRNTVDGLTKFERNILNLGVGGNWAEMFFDPVMAAVSPISVVNTGFFRSDSFLVLILITDTFDQSNENSGFKVYNTLINSKANDRDKVLGYGVLSFPSYFGDICNQDGTFDPINLFEFLGFFTNALNSQIGGGALNHSPSSTFPASFYNMTNVFSLCDPNFGQKLAEIGEDIRIRVSQKISLPVRPVDGTIKLKYGTQIVDKKWWKYDFGTNSIILDPSVELDESQQNAQLFVVMDQADLETALGDPKNKN